MGAALSCFKKRGERAGAKDAGAAPKEKPSKAEKAEKVKEASAAAGEEIVPKAEEVTEEASKAQREEIVPKEEKGEKGPKHEPDGQVPSARALPEDVPGADVGTTYVDDLVKVKEPASGVAYVPPKPSAEPIPVEQFWDVKIKGLERQKPPPDEEKEESDKVEETPEESEEPEEPEEPEEKPDEPEEKPDEPEERPDEPEEKPGEPGDKPEEPEEKPEEPEEKPGKPEERPEKPEKKPEEPEKMAEEQEQASGQKEDKPYSESLDLPDVHGSVLPDGAPKTPVKEEITMAERSLVSDRKARFEQAKDELPKPKPLSKDIKDPVTGEMVTLEEFQKRIKKRGGVVDRNVTKYEEISEKAAQEQAELEAQREHLELTRKNSRTKSTASTDLCDKEGPLTPQEVASPEIGSPSVSTVTPEKASVSESTAVKGLLGIPSAPVVSETSTPETSPPAERLQKDSLSTPDTPGKGAMEPTSSEMPTASGNGSPIDAAVAALIDADPSDTDLERPRAGAVPESFDHPESATRDEAQEGLPKSAAPGASLAEAPEFSELPKLDSTVVETPVKAEGDALPVSDIPGVGASSLPVESSTTNKEGAPIDVVQDPGDTSPVSGEAKFDTSDAPKVTTSPRKETEETSPEAPGKVQESAEPVKPLAPPQGTSKSGVPETASAQIAQSGTPSAKETETKSSESPRGFFKNISRRLSSPNRDDVPHKSRVKEMARKISVKLSS